MKWCVPSRLPRSPQPVSPLQLEGILAFQNVPQQDVLKMVGLCAFGAMLTMAIRTTLSARARAAPRSFLRSVIVAYSVATPIFALVFGLYGSSKLLLVLAALHNLCEWGIIWHLVLETSAITPTFYGSVLWIWTIVSIVAVAPTLELAVAIEQPFGLWCDFLLFFLMLKRLSEVQEGDVYLRRLFLMGLVASIVHFGQIFTLILGGLGVPGTTLWLLLLVFSPLVTFGLYSEFALRWDEAPVPPYRQHHMNVFEAFFIFILSLVLSTSVIFGPPLLFRCPAVAAQASSQCSQSVSGFTVFKAASPNVRNALGDFLREVAHSTLAEPGNEIYEVFEVERGKGGSDEWDFAVVERYWSLEALQTHLKRVEPLFNQEYYHGLAADMVEFGPWRRAEWCQPSYPPQLRHLAFRFAIDNDVDAIWSVVRNWRSLEALQTHLKRVEPLFNQEYYHGLAADMIEFGPWRRAEWCQPSYPPQLRHLAFRFTIDNDVDAIWSVVRNWSDVTMVLGAVSAELDENDERLRVVKFRNGLELEERLSVLDHSQKRLVYEHSNQLGLRFYRGSINLESNGTGGTLVSYVIDIGLEGDAQGRSDAMKASFQGQNIPYLQERFSHAGLSSNALLNEGTPVIYDASVVEKVEL
ncbi:unnamed protein product [Vitrella brassicaformis CCMP3155]|uniref:Uncharacterized protein n=1 Tax=Vitrella brassicaformis (strain CCMP3155) TaxID=1169540 RepID=A0A0G4GSY9_VITBC|nr:unnamed protein product [Vitrella brassicaformis CCMP3155]|eukprot:CEM33832.1 unnamed protein product [Vitrella brassicaformis CCMP3155]